MMRLVVNDENKAFYGGDQRWFSDKTGKDYGCGVIACANVFCFLRDRESEDLNIDKRDYMQLAADIRRWMPLVPYVGLDGFRMAFGFNLYMRKQGLPYRTYWGTFGGHMLSEIHRMLAQRIPVVMSVGMEFPKVWTRRPVHMFRGKVVQGKSDHCRKHFVTIFAVDDKWLLVSSWGMRYYVLKEEFFYHMKHHSNIIFDNILVVREKK